MPRPQLKLVANVSEFGLFQGFARTRTRLIATTIVSTIIMIALGLWSANHILEHSASVSMNLLLITTNMFVMMVGSYMQALLIGDFFFPGPWREQVILGVRPEQHDHDAEIAVRNHNAEFMIVLLLLLASNAFLINLASHNFIDTYHNEGFFRVRLRHEEPKERMEALKDMVEPTQADLWTLPGLHKVVISALDDPDPGVRGQAIWNVGKMGIESARERVLSLLKDPKEHDEVLATASIALGRLGKSFESRAAIEQLLTRKNASPTLLIGALRGLALMKDEDGGAAIMPLTQHPDDQVAIHAYFALRESLATDARQPILDALNANPAPPKLRQCAMLDTLKMISKEEDIPWAQKQFVRTDPTLKCEPIVWEDRDERRRYVLYYDDLRTKYIKIVANSGGAPAHKRWFELIASDPSEPWPVREVASLVLKQLK